MTLPNFLCIGAQRAGTTWLYDMLSRHPDLFLSAQKELHFFDEKPDFSTYEGLGNPGQRFFYDMNSSAHWHWYQEQFRLGEGYKVRGEMTPFYATLSEQRAALIAKRLPDLKIIYVIRNPVKRAWSGFRLFWFLETKHQECHLESEALRKTIMYPAKLIHGDYRRNTDVWEKCFNRDRILYLFYDDIVQTPQRVLDRVLTFLRVTPHQFPASDIAEKVNRAPDVSMPELIEKVLTDYYTNQMAFIEAKFGRALKY